MKIEKLIVALLGVFVSVLVPFSAAQATSIDISYSGSAIFGNGAAGYEIGGIAPNPGSETNLAYVYMGGDSVKGVDKDPLKPTDLGIVGIFNVWCVDIYHWMATSATYNVETGAELATDLDPLRGKGTTRVNQLLQLADEVYSTLDSKKDNAAFQLAVWEITYGTADSSGIYKINTTDTGFRVDSTTANSNFAKQANEWLANLGNAANSGNYKLTYLSDAGRENTQDLVVFTQSFSPSSSSTVPVPEPNSLVLLALAGLGFLKRKQA